jgi:tape measure domain-containing protein
MSSIDNRIVSMQFDNAKFEQGVSTTMSTLDRLKQALTFGGTTKGMDQVSTAADGMGRSVDGISARFAALATVAITALANITNRAVDAGIRLTKSLSVDPILQGYNEYETKLQSIQTILANTEAAGTNLDDVKNALNELNKYSDQTIYNFGEMAKNIGTFTAAGVDLDTAVGSIKGIANLAALSGSNSQQAATAMYQLSQAISAGRVSLQDWNSVVNAGMGGTTFQRALAQTAVTMGKLPESALKLTGPMKNVSINGQSFRESISAIGGESWLTGDVLTSTLQQFTGDMTKAELASMGFNDQQIANIQQMAETARRSATVVKTGTQLIGVLQESIGSGWAQTWETIIGDFEEAPKVFTNVNNVLSGFINRSADMRNAVLKDWGELGGRTAVIKGIGNIFTGLISVLKPIRDAFRDIFPRTTGAQLAQMSKAFRDFTANLKIGGETAENLRRTFRGVFAVFHIVGTVIKGILGVFGDLLGAAAGASGGILEFTGGIGDFLVKVDEAISKGGLLNGFFEGLGVILSVPIQILGDLGNAFASLFENIDASFLGKIADAFDQIGQAIAGAFNPQNVDAAGSVLGAGILGGIFLVIKQFIGKVTTLFSGGIFGGGGFLDSIKDTFQTLTNSLAAFQTQIQAKTLILIAGALALLTASVVALSFVDTENLAKSLGALGAAMALLMTAMAVLIKISGSAGFVKVPIMAASLVLLATALDLLTLAILGMSTLSWTEIAKGLTGIAGALIILGLALKTMKGNIRGAAALLIIAPALVAVATAMKIFGTMSIEEMAKSMIVLALSLKILAGGLSLFGKKALPGAAAMLIVAPALAILAAALALMGSLSLEKIGKGLLAMAGSLIVLAVGLSALGIKGLIGALAIKIIAPALLLLAAGLIALGSIPWGVLLKGMLVLAGGLILIGVAGAALVSSGAVLGILGLGAAMFMLGAGIALAGAGILAFTTALSLLIAIGGAGLSFMLGMVEDVLGLIPLAMGQLAVGVIQFAVVIAKGAPVLIAAFMKIINSMLDAIVKNTPKFEAFFNKMIDTGIRVVTRNVPKMASAGLKLINALLREVAKNVGKIVDSATKLIINFLRALQRNQPKVANEGAKTIIAFINGTASAIRKNSRALGKAAANLGLAIVEGIADGIAGGAGVIVAAAKKAAQDAFDAAKKKLGIGGPAKLFLPIGGSIPQGIAKGIDKDQWYVDDAIDGVAAMALGNLQSAISAISDSVNGEINLDPVITPVLDLSNVEANASRLNSLLGATDLSSGVSIDRANHIVIPVGNEPTDGGESPSVKVELTQNNNSPKSLSSAEIYRNTKNLVSLAKTQIEETVKPKV